MLEIMFLLKLMLCGGVFPPIKKPQGGLSGLSEHPLGCLPTNLDELSVQRPL